MPRVVFEKIEIDPDHKCEAAALADVNGDGQLDIIAGTHWYEGPDWVKHPLRDIAYQSEYFDDFANLPMDINGNGRPDVIGCGWFGKSIAWYENPGSPDAPWPEHVIDSGTNYETAALFDVDGDGVPEIVPNTPNEPVCFYRLNRDDAGAPAGAFTRHDVSTTNQGHGLGAGDLTGNGRCDLIVANGWYEAPPDPCAGPWDFHPELGLERTSVPMLVHDVNNDGLPDILYGHAHGYGLFWLEQHLAGDGSRQWVSHEIDSSFSQAHYLALVDIDGDGEDELVTGKRYRAHNGKDPGGTDPCCLYYYKIDRRTAAFERFDIDVGNQVGVGLHLAIADVDGDGRPDLVCPGKGGLYLFLNRGVE